MGQTIGVVALAGGHLMSDLVIATAAMKRPVPLVIDRSVDSASNAFGTEDLLHADEELALDLQVLAGVAVDARLVVYFAPNTLQGLTDAVHDAATDTANRPSVLSVSWGSAERFWSAAARDAMQAALSDAAVANVTVVAAAGDDLATDGLTDGAAHVLFPASSPYVLACGGTQMTFSAAGGSLAGEAVWNEGFVGTGGGVSDVFAMPAYQRSAGLPPSVNDGRKRRGLPDVAAAAASAPGYRIVVNGEERTRDGTSAAAPMWAGLIALANAARGRHLGLVHPFLYSNSWLCHGITDGNNRVQGLGYDAGSGWNACAGLGSPRADELVKALAAIP